MTEHRMRDGTIVYIDVNPSGQILFKLQKENDWKTVELKTLSRTIVIAEESKDRVEFYKRISS